MRPTSNAASNRTMTRTSRNKSRRAAMLVALFAIVALGGCRSLSLGLFETGRSAMRAMAGVEAGTVDVGGREVGYLHREGEGPPLVLLHGFASEKDVWLRFLRHADKEVEVYALDLPGHGDSTRDPEFSYDIPAIVTDIETALASLTDEPINLVGTSLGGMIAAYYAARNPDRVLTLALYAPAGIYPSNPSQFQHAIARGENPLIVNEPREFDALVDIVFFDPPPLVWPVGPALRQIAVARSDFNNKIWNDLWPGHPTLDDALPAIELPVLLVWGREDRVLDVSSAEGFERLLPRVQTVIVDEAGHAIINEKPAEMAVLHSNFLARQPCATPANRRATEEGACLRPAWPARAAPASGE